VSLKIVQDVFDSVRDFIVVRVRFINIVLDNNQIF
jgi:hypothetical protein